MSIVMYHSFSSTTSLYHESGGEQPFQETCENIRKTLGQRDLNQGSNSQKKTHRQIHFSNLKDAVRMNHVMAKSVDDEGYKEQLPLQCICYGLQKEFQICNQINTVTVDHTWCIVNHSENKHTFFINYLPIRIGKL